MKCCDLTAGKLKHVGSLQSLNKIPDGGGGNKVGWVTYSADQRMFIKPLNASERVFAQRLEHNITHKCWMRYRTDIKPDHSILFEGRRMQIRGIIDIEEAKKWLEISLEEGVVT